MLAYVPPVICKELCFTLLRLPAARFALSCKIHHLLGNSDQHACPPTQRNLCYQSVDTVIHLGNAEQLTAKTTDSCSNLRLAKWKVWSSKGQTSEVSKALLIGLKEIREFKQDFPSLGVCHLPPGRVWLECLIGASNSFVHVLVASDGDTIAD